MNALLKKEIRMLLPAFAGALALAIAPVWLLPFDTANPGMIPDLLFLFGVMMLALSSFGPEVRLKTMPFLLALPLERSRIWWTKVSLLGVCIVMACGAWKFSSSLHYVRNPVLQAMPGMQAFFVVSVAMYATGGVWLTLLLRQIIAAFWLAILIPWAVALAIEAMGATDWMVFTALGLYSIAAFFLARRQFLHFQDTAWTGGAITFDRRRAVTTASLIRERGPWRALLGKELKLHEFTLAGMAALFVLHLGVVLLRKFGALGFTTRVSLESFSLLWIVVPMVAGSQSVAEERQLGTLDGVLCLAISRRAQYGIKLIFVLVIGGLLSATLMCAAEWIASAIGAGTGPVVGNAFEFHYVVTLFLALSLVSFFASTLTLSVVQALAAGVVVAAVFGWLAGLVEQRVAYPVIGRRLWAVMAGPGVTVAIIWLGYGNFKQLLETGRRWRRNVLVLTAVIALSEGAAAAVYNRAWGLWDCFAPMEGAHGPARLAADKPVAIRAYRGDVLAAILPDGRLWMDHVAYGWRVTLGGARFVPGSNWVDVALLAEETVAIRSDGTLWVSEKPGSPDTLVQFGRDTDWQSVVRFTESSVVLLKKEGTRWGWGPYAFSPLRLIKNRRGNSWALGTNIFRGAYPGLRTAKPEQVGADSDWARMIQGNRRIYAWKRDGHAWECHEPVPNEKWSDRRLPALDDLQIRSASPSGLELWIRDDGTLWWHRMWAVEPKADKQELLQIGKDTNWVAVVSGPSLLVLKSDGSLWTWKPLRNGEWADGVLENAPERLGTNSDWVGLGFLMGKSIALSADGAIWGWPSQERGPWDSGDWVVPSRRAIEMVNMFDAKE